jgi:hypothetical protein
VGLQQEAAGWPEDAVLVTAGAAGSTGSFLPAAVAVAVVAGRFPKLALVPATLEEEASEAFAATFVAFGAFVVEKWQKLVAPLNVAGQFQEGTQEAFAKGAPAQLGQP